MSILIRKAQFEDRQSLYEVEKKATPGLIYLPHVFDQFTTDEAGEFLMAEIDGKAVGCGKFTLLPDGSAWLETLRVLPEWQGHGVGKAFYERFFEAAHARKVKAMRMYTSLSNYASKGLAEKFGFSIAGTFVGQKLPVQPHSMAGAPAAFQRVEDMMLAEELLLSHSEQWGGFLVMNRTFYTVTPALARVLVERGMFYYNPETRLPIILGARFMPHQALHIGMMNGDMDAGLAFAMQKCIEVGAANLSCMSPVSAESFQAELARRGFVVESAEFIVMEVKL